jgi:hypothetical protein
LEPLAAAQGEGAAGSINEAVALAQAGLWRAAGEQVAALSSAQVQASTRPRAKR